MRTTKNSIVRDARGISFAELMMALVVLSIGWLAVAQFFPLDSRGPGQDRMQTVARYYAEEKIEQFVNLSWNDPALSPGRHPAENGSEDLGSWRRFYRVEVLGPPLGHLKRVTVIVTWSSHGSRSVAATTYVRP